MYIIAKRFVLLPYVTSFPMLNFFIGYNQLNPPKIENLRKCWFLLFLPFEQIQCWKKSNAWLYSMSSYFE